MADTLSHSEESGKEAARAIRKEFKYGTPDAQKRAIRVWAILCLNATDRFRLQTAQKRFLEVVEDLATSKKTKPPVKSSMLNALSALAYQYKDDKDMCAITKTYNKVKPSDRPLNGEPLDPHSEEFMPPMDAQTRRRQRRGRHLSQEGEIPPHLNPLNRIVPRDVDFRKLHEECAIAMHNSHLLIDAIEVGGLHSEVVSEFATKVHLSQDFILAQIPWASAESSKAREKHGAGGETTPEEKLLADLLAATEYLNKATTMLKAGRRRETDQSSLSFGSIASPDLSSMQPAQQPQRSRTYSSESYTRRIPPPQLTEPVSNSTSRNAEHSLEVMQMDPSEQARWDQQQQMHEQQQMIEQELHEQELHDKQVQEQQRKQIRAQQIQEQQMRQQQMHEQQIMQQQQEQRLAQHQQEQFTQQEMYQLIQKQRQAQQLAYPLQHQPGSNLVASPASQPEQMPYGSALAHDIVPEQRQLHQENSFASHERGSQQDRGYLHQDVLSSHASHEHEALPSQEPRSFPGSEREVQYELSEAHSQGALAFQSSNGYNSIASTHDYVMPEHHPDQLAYSNMSLHDASGPPLPQFHRGGPRPFPGSSAFMQPSGTPPPGSTYADTNLESSQDLREAPTAPPMLAPITTSDTQSHQLVPSPTASDSSSIIETPIVPSAKALGKRRAVSVHEGESAQIQFSVDRMLIFRFIPDLVPQNEQQDLYQRMITHDDEEEFSHFADSTTSAQPPGLDGEHMAFLRSRPMPPQPVRIQ